MSEKRCYTVQELQEILGVSRPTIYNLLKKKEFRWIQLDGGKYRMINKWADKGKFTVIKVGSRVRIRRDEFEDWMEQRDLERSMQ